MTRVTRVAPMLLRGRISAGHGLIDLIGVAAFTVSSWLLFTVLAGLNVFIRRQDAPPNAFVTAVGLDPSVSGATLLAWTLIAACASVLLVVPVLTLGAAAARIGALGRDQRLSTLRLLGVTGAQVVRLSTLETMLTALVGAVLGLAVYLVSLPAWAAIRFQATPLSAAEMLLPIGAIAGIIGLVVVLAGLSSITGLMRLQISPLGVARRAPRPAMKVWRFVALPVLVVAWLVGAPLVIQSQTLIVSVTVILVVLAVFMGVINLFGPWVLQLLGRILSRSGRPAVLLAGRRLLADPKGTWRSVSGLAFVGFTGGALTALPDLGSAATDPLSRILAEDLQTGTYLTLAIAFVVAAASTLLNQASAVLDHRQELHQLGNLGVPESLHHRTRLVEVVVPAAFASLGSGGLAVYFFGVLEQSEPSQFGSLAFLGTLVVGIALVWAAGEACRPLVRSAVAGAGPRPD